MYEYEVVILTTKERRFCWGYTLADALGKHGLTVKEVFVLSREFID